MNCRFPCGLQNQTGLLAHHHQQLMQGPGLGVCPIGIGSKSSKPKCCSLFYCSQLCSDFVITVHNKPVVLSMSLINYCMITVHNKLLYDHCP